MSVHWVEYLLQPWCFQTLAVMFRKYLFCPGRTNLVCADIPWYCKEGFSCHIRPSTENNFGMPFKERKLPATHQCSERKRQDISVFAIMIGDIALGKSPGWLSWAKGHWGLVKYTEVNEGSNHVYFNLLFSGVIAMAILPWFYELALFLCPCLCKQGMVLHNLPSPEKRTCLKCFSGSGKSLHQTRALKPRGATLVSVS